MCLKNKVIRAFFKLAKLPLWILYHLNHRWFMKMYIPLLKFCGMKIKTPRFIGFDTYFDQFSLINIGDYTTISEGCIFLTHDYSITNAFRSVGNEPKSDISLIRGISVGDNCFIGMKTIILPNCKIGNNCIIGAGSVVRGVIPDDSLVIGNPSKIIDSVSHHAEKWMKVNNSNIRID